MASLAVLPVGQSAGVSDSWIRDARFGVVRPASTPRAGPLRKGGGLSEVKGVRALHFRCGAARSRLDQARAAA